MSITGGIKRPQPLSTTELSTAIAEIDLTTVEQAISTVDGKVDIITTNINTIDGNVNTLVNELPAWSDSDFASVGGDWDAEDTIFEISLNERYELIGISISLDSDAWANAKNWTFRVYAAYAVDGGDYRLLGNAISGLAGSTLPRAIPIDDLAGFSYIKVTAEQTDDNTDDAHEIEYMYTLKETE